jgi:hypothetical protein
MGSFWLAFSASARLEPPGEPFQHHFDDLVLFFVPFLCNLYVILLKMYRIVGGRLAPSVLPFSSPSSPSYPSSPSFSSFCLLACWLAGACERSEAERGRCVVEAAPQARPEDHFDCNICGIPLFFSNVRPLRFLFLFLLLWLDTTWDSVGMSEQLCFPFFGCSGFYRFWVDFGTPF